MKAVVLEVKDGKAIVLTEDGLTRKIKYDGQIGEEIELKANIVPMKKKRVASAIAAAVAVSVIAGGVYTQSLHKTDSYVAMNEEDPSSEGSEEAGNSSIDTGSCQESEADSEKMTDQRATEKQKVLEEETEEKAAKDTKPSTTQTDKKKDGSKDKTGNQSVMEDSAGLYQMQQQYDVQQQSAQQQASSDTAVGSSAAESGKKKKQTEPELSSQVLASADTDEGDQTVSTELSSAGEETLTPEEAMAQAAEIAEKAAVEAAQAAAAEEAARLAAEQEATGTQINSGAVNAPIVPDQPGVPLEE